MREIAISNPPTWEHETNSSNRRVSRQNGSLDKMDKLNLIAVNQSNQQLWDIFIIQRTVLFDVNKNMNIN